MKRFAAVLAVLLLPGVGWGQIAVKGEATYKPHEPIVLTASGISPKAQCIWDVYGLDPSQVREVGNALHVWAPPGKYTVSLLAVDFEAKKIDRARYAFAVGDAPPVPPVPPDPGPGPKPDPKPTTGLKVLIIYETAELSKMTPAQRNILYDPTIRAYLDSKCPLESDGKTHTWTMQDQNQNLGTYFPGWSDLMAKAKKTSIPWIVIASGNNVIVHEAALPATVQDTLALLARYAPSPSLRKAG